LLKVDLHSLQSPFVYDFYENVFQVAKAHNAEDPIESLRASLSESMKEIPTFTLGAPSRHGTETKKTIRDLVKKGGTSPFGCRLLELVIRQYKCKTIYELGTSLGLTTLYLSRPEQTRVYTFEGNAALLSVAEENFSKFKRNNIQIISGNIDDTLPETLAQTDVPDLVYIDANHRMEPTLRYVHQFLKTGAEHMIIVLDDIYWSPEMTQAWNILLREKAVQVSLDLYSMGILILRRDLTPGHYIF
jgi:predicted O-methyltransferase YrrM